MLYLMLIRLTHPRNVVGFDQKGKMTMSNKTQFVALDPQGKRLGTFESQDAAAGMCQDAVREANDDEDAASQYEVVKCGSIEIVVVGPELTQDHTTPSQYRRLCDRLERCYSALEKPTQYSVSVRPARSGEAPGTYYRKASGDLQILGYSLETPEDLTDLSDEAWNLFCSGKRIPR
jgi:hypothetical protein